MRAPKSGCACWRCGIDTAFNRAAGLLKTLAGQLAPGPTFSDQVAPAYPQPQRKRDGIPYTGLISAIRIDAPNNPDLILNPVTATTWYLRSTARLISAPVRHTRTVYPGKDFAWRGRGG